MPNLDDSELAGSWANLSVKAQRLLGEIPISDVEFDATLRHQVNLTILAHFDS